MARKGNVSNKAAERRYPLVPLRDQVVFPGVISTLLVAREATQAALDVAINGNQLVFCTLQKVRHVEFPVLSDLHETGTICEVLHLVPLPDGSYRAAVRGVAIGNASGIEKGQAKVSHRNEQPQPTESIPYQRVLQSLFTQIIEGSNAIPPESLDSVLNARTGAECANFVAHYLPFSVSEKQALLEIQDCGELLPSIVKLAQRELEIVQVEATIRHNLEQDLETSRRDFLLREQLKVIQRELKFDESHDLRIDELEAKCAQIDLSPLAKRELQAELNRLRSSDPDSSEAQSIRHYLDTVFSLPWGKYATAEIDLQQAQAILDQRHYGLKLVKEAAIEFLAVQKLRAAKKGSALLFVGPPGVGKTSVAQSLAVAMGRPSVSIALGGLRDEAELRGHRRTYVAARLGRILAAIRQSGVMNPVIILDEIDKLQTGAMGDPASALLEILDFEQNREFIDHYLEVGFDLSNVTFIATANWVDPIPAALRDRLEIIEFSGYSDKERLEIAQKFVVPRVTAESGLAAASPIFTEAAISLLATGYGRESGVRGLERNIFRISRKLAVELAMSCPIPSILDEDEVVKRLGPPIRSVGELRDAIGTSHGLVVTPHGGDRMLIEISLTKPVGPEPKLTLTGTLGPIIQESVQTALTCVRSMLDHRQVDTRFDVHVHLPQAAIPKDGPSAGVTIACALYSAFLGKPLRGDVAMTGEITLRGVLLEIGGLREKILAAKRYGYRVVVFPQGQAEEVAQLSPEITEGIELRPIQTLSGALEIVVAQAQTVSIL